MVGDPRTFTVETLRVEWLSGQQAFYLAAAAVLATLGALLVVRQPAPAERPRSLTRLPPIAAAVGVIGGIYGIGGGSFLAPILMLGAYTAYAVAPAALLSTLAASIVGAIAFVALGLTSDSSARSRLTGRGRIEARPARIRRKGHAVGRTVSGVQRPGAAGASEARRSRACPSSTTSPLAR